VTLVQCRITWFRIRSRRETPSIALSIARLATLSCRPAVPWVSKSRLRMSWPVERTDWRLSSLAFLGSTMKRLDVVSQVSIRWRLLFPTLCWSSSFSYPFPTQSGVGTTCVSSCCNEDYFNERPLAWRQLSLKLEWVLTTAIAVVGLLILSLWAYLRDVGARWRAGTARPPARGSTRVHPSSWCAASPARASAPTPRRSRTTLARSSATNNISQSFIYLITITNAKELKSNLNVAQWPPHHHPINFNCNFFIS
jgi:hypothetical protein